MIRFANLIKTLDSTNKTNAKVKALASYFSEAPDADKVWTIAILSHRRPPRPVNTTLLRTWASELANIPLWLFEESYHIVGDLAETIALVVPNSKNQSEKNLTQFLKEMILLKPKSEEEKKEYLFENWKVLNYYERFVFTKLITGGFRIGVSQKLMTRALSQATGIDEDILAYKLMGNWDPATITFKDLVLEQRVSDYLSKPYPFYLAYAVEEEITALGNIQDWPNGQIGTFNDLQTRIGRKTVSKALLQKTPVILKAYDLLEWQGEDIRNRPFSERRTILENLYANISSSPKIAKDKEAVLQLSEKISFSSWSEVAAERQQAREMRSEGLMLKKKNSPYLVGRKKGDWWKWKVDPLTIDAVLTYAMRGHGRRSNLFTDYTFGLWNNDRTELVTFAKAYSGLTDVEFKQVDKFIKANTLERFGPVRSVKATLVFEIAFEGIAASKRHKSGVATRFPRILRWRHDKKIEEANTLADLKALIPITTDQVSTKKQS